MTDHPPDDDPDRRAEQALRDALARHSQDLDPRPLTAPTRPRSALVPLVAAAAAVALVVSLAWAAQRGDDPGAPPSATRTTTPTSAAAAPRPTTSVVPRPGVPTRTVGFLDVRVDVPATWDDGDAPTDQWCVSGRTRSDFPTTPYVSRDRSTSGSTLVACGGDTEQPAWFPPVPPRYWAPHLSLLPLDRELGEGVETFREWTLTTRFVGSVAVQLLTDEATTPLVDTILDSAQVRDEDANGCEVTSPIQSSAFVRPPAADVTAIDAVTSIAVCQYVRGRTDEPGLIASRVLQGDQAAAELAAIQDAPVGGGPDDPESCSADYFGDQAIVLRLRNRDAAETQLYVYYDWCFGNGVDDGTTRRAITLDNCDPLWGDPVLQYSGGGSTFPLCHPENTAG